MPTPKKQAPKKKAVKKPCGCHGIPSRFVKGNSYVIAKKDVAAFRKKFLAAGGRILTPKQRKALKDNPVCPKGCTCTFQPNGSILVEC